MENDSVVYQNKLIEVRDQLSDATFQMDSMANEHLSMKESVKNHVNLIDSLQQENRRLALQMEEYLEWRRDQQQRMETMGSEIESRMAELSGIIATKDAEIEELKNRLAKNGVGGSRRGQSAAGGDGAIPETEENVALLTQAVREREEKIDDLQEKLAMAAK